MMEHFSALIHAPGITPQAYIEQRTASGLVTINLVEGCVVLPEALGPQGFITQILPHLSSAVRDRYREWMLAPLRR